MSKTEPSHKSCRFETSFTLALCDLQPACIRYYVTACSYLVHFLLRVDQVQAEPIDRAVLNK
jgi:hypothetical protein